MLFVALLRSPASLLQRGDEPLTLAYFTLLERASLCP